MAALSAARVSAAPEAAAGGKSATAAGAARAASGDAPVASKRRRKKKKKSGRESEDTAECMVVGDAASRKRKEPPASAATAVAEAETRVRTPRRSASTPSLTSTSAGVDGPSRFAVGQAVAIQGLVGKPELNGQIGSVFSYDAFSDRFAVRLVSRESVLVRAENLRLSVFALGASPS